MKDICYVLLKKEQDILRVRHEIEALRLVIPLLSDEKPSRGAEGESILVPERNNRWPLQIPGLH